MDREKAIQILKRCGAESYCSHYKRHYCCIGCGQREALDLAIEALQGDTEGDAESATTTDCISREQAIEALCDKCVYGRHECGGNCEDVVTVLRNLPPVTPKERTGEWVVHPLIDDGRVELECSECGDTFVRAVDYKPDFCETCGAKMGGDTE